MIQKTLSINLPINLSASVRTLVFIGFSILSFIVPFYLGHPQWLVGTIVNACLFSSAIFLPKKFFWPIIIFPSLGVLARGLIFGPLTPFLVYFLPFIWASNLILISVFKKLFSYLNYIPSLFVAALAKFLFLLIIANVYFGFNIIPKVFLQTMGIFQFLTALSGGIISLVLFNYGGYNARNKKVS